MNLFDPILGRLHQFIRGESDEEISDVLKDVFEENIKKDFIYKSQWSSLEVLSVKIHFKHEESE